jgi:hypothetical protein
VLQLLAAALAWTVAAAAQEPAAPEVRASLVLAPSQVLAPPTAAELLLGSWIEAVPLRGRAPEDVPVRTVVVREIPELWELRIPAEVPLESLDVSYEIVADDGVRYRLSGAGDEIPIKLRPGRPVLVRREGPLAVVRGGAVLELHVQDVRRAGTYRGQLRVSVERSGAVP